MQTAVGVFGGKGHVDGMDVPPLMVANAGNNNRSAYSSLNCPPFVAVELCREHLVQINGSVILLIFKSEYFSDFCWAMSIE